MIERGRERERERKGVELLLFMAKAAELMLPLAVNSGFLVELNSSRVSPPTFTCGWEMYVH